ncbi:MAG: acyltransferase [Methylobacteriaceae bacterium]|nr:acyltransferase [Methylobacteriaceae bacterium]
MSQQSLSPQVSRFIDVARWIAALAVLFTHVEANSLVRLAEMPAGSRGILAYAAWLLYGFAHQAVVVFFVLSGFLVGGGALKAARAGRPFLATYLIDRTTRIYVVLLPVLALTALIDAAGRTLFADTNVYALPEFANRSGALEFWANVFNLQDTFFRYFGTNSALWTLAHEFWYYVAFALLIMPFASAYSPRARACGFAAGLAITVSMSWTLSYHLFGFALWGLGVVAARLSKPLVARRALALALFLAASIGLRLFVRYSLIEIWWIGGIADAVIALLFANLLLTLRFDPKPIWRWCEAPAHRALSDFSYSLYALHMPVVVFLCAAAQHFLGFGFRSAPTSAAHWLVFLTILFTAVGVTWGFSRLTEARTDIVRRFARNLFDKRPQPQVTGAPAKG